ncbi:MAG: nucleotidyltransferase domain-containing protein [Spirochaetales bacterium]|nr:nucleotidyltransferase domain-containing protein [Spirochaetales bacterium]
MDKRSTAVQKLRIYFAEQSEVELAILYGSFASGKISDASDIDIAVHTKENASLERLIDIQTDISALVHREVDLLDLRQAEGTILCRVLGKGIKLKENNILFAHYNLQAIYFHEDFLKTVRIMQNARIRRFINGS